MEVKGSMQRYSVLNDSEEDIRNYIENYLTEDGYISNLEIDYDDYYNYDVKEFEREISVYEFTSTDAREYEYWIDANDEYYTDIYLLQKWSGNMCLVTRLMKNVSFDYEEYFSQNEGYKIKYYFE